jgi:hypothetical protein
LVIEAASPDWRGAQVVACVVGGVPGMTVVWEVTVAPRCRWGSTWMEEVPSEGGKSIHVCLVFGRAAVGHEHRAAADRAGTRADGGSRNATHSDVRTRSAMPRKPVGAVVCFALDALALALALDALALALTRKPPVRPAPAAAAAAFLE